MLSSLSWSMPEITVAFPEREIQIDRFNSGVYYFKFYFYVIVYKILTVFYYLDSLSRVHMQKARQCDLHFNRFPLWHAPDTGRLSYSQKRPLKENDMYPKVMEKKQKGLPPISSPVLRKTIISLYNSDSLKNMIPLLNCELKKNPEEIRRECVAGSLKGPKIGRKGDFDLESGLLCNETESIELLSESLSTKLTKSVSLASHNLSEQHLP